jgi:hypothetical protein
VLRRDVDQVPANQDVATETTEATQRVHAQAQPVLHKANKLASDYQRMDGALTRGGRHD